MKKIIFAVLVINSCFLLFGQCQGKRPLFGAPTLLATAKSWEGKYFRKGQSLQCANWVGAVATSSGCGLPKNHSLARSWLNWGRPVSLAAIQPGDVVVTWRGSKSGTSGHILIYVGGGQCIHRPTYSKPVQKTPLSSYKSRILGVRRVKVETLSFRGRSLKSP